jgi:hypothetical protein
MATTTGEDDNDGKEDNSEDNGNKMATTARMTGKEGRITGEDDDDVKDNKGGHFWWRRPW